MQLNQNQASGHNRDEVLAQAGRILDQGGFVDAALCLGLEHPVFLGGMLSTLVAGRKWEVLRGLVSALGDLGLLAAKDASSALASACAGLPAGLEAHLSAEGKPPPPDPSPGLAVLRLGLEYAPASAELVAQVDRAEAVYAQAQERLRAMAVGGDLARAHQLLLRMAGDDRLGGEHDKCWTLLRKGGPEAHPMPQAVADRYAAGQDEQRMLELASAFLKGGSAPESCLQRKDLFRFLFSRHWILASLPAEQRDAFLREAERARRDRDSLSVEWLGDKKDPAPAKAERVRRLQCLVAPDAMVDFCSAFLEMRMSQEAADAETASRHILQAEAQLPRVADIRRDRKDAFGRLSGLVSGMRDHVSRRRVEELVGDGRHRAALPYLTQALRSGAQWAADVLRDRHRPFLDVLSGCEGPELPMFLIAALRHKACPEPVRAAARAIGQEWLRRASGMLEGGEDRLDLSGLFLLHRAAHFGVPQEELSKPLESFRARLRMEAQTEIQQLAFKVGDALGEAISKSSVITIPTRGDDKAQEIGDQLSRLYERFKDVLVQQDPYERSSKKILGEILADAMSLIQEADSIHVSKAVSAYERIRVTDKSGIHELLLGGEESVHLAVSRKFLQDEPYLERQMKNGEVKRMIAEHVIMRNYARILAELVVTEISLQNNPLLMQLGTPLEDFLDFGLVPLSWWAKGDLALKASQVFPEQPPPREPIVINDRFVISHVLDWLRFENEEALKVPFRKGMSVVCTHLTNAMAQCRREADGLFRDIVYDPEVQKHAELAGILVQLRKATYQLNSLDTLKNSGILPPNYNRSLEPRVRSFSEGLSDQLSSYDRELCKGLRARLPLVFEYDKNEFRLGMLLKDKERALKKYLHANLSELTRNYLTEGQRASIPSRIQDVCIRLQQGISTRRNEMRNVRYNPVLLDAGAEMQTPGGIREMLGRFEENLPIIDRISGSRQAVDSSFLAFDAARDGRDRKGLKAYMEKVDGYLDNAQKFARQLRIIILPGVGNGSFEPASNSLCIPLCAPAKGGRENSVLCALADYLHHVKFQNEGNEVEEALLDILNRKQRTPVKPGSHEAQIKVTALIHREITVLCGIKGAAPNPSNISAILVRNILGADNSMIYRELRNLSAPQKQERYDMLKDRYNCLRRNVPPEEGILDVVFPMQKKDEGGVGAVPERKDASLYRVFPNLAELDQFAVKDELYDLAVLLHHYGRLDQSVLLFRILTRLDPHFPEAFWGLGTVARSPALTVLNAGERESEALRAFRCFTEFGNVGPFWRRRAMDILKNMSQL